MCNILRNIDSQIKRNLVCSTVKYKLIDAGVAKQLKWIYADYYWN